MNYQIAALNLALDALENTASRRASEQFVIEQHAIAFIKKSLDRVDPAPVAKNEEGRITWIIDDWPQNCFLYSEPPSWTPVEIGVDVTQEGTHVVGMYVLMPEAVRHVFYSKFHPAPTKKEWVGLTYADLYFWGGELGLGELGKGVLRAVDAHLREKNSGHVSTKKEWVGLTAYEIQEIHFSNQHFGNFACAIEAKLKEKNHGNG